MTATADNTARTQAVDAKATAERTVFGILIAISVAHGLNDIIQSLIPAIYPILKDEFRLDFGQIGLITLAFQLTASLLQPMVGLYTDKRPLPYSLAVGMGFTLAGLLTARLRDELPHAAGRRGAGRHGLVRLPSRILARGAHGLRRAARARAVALPGRRQCGSAAGPLLAAFVVLPHGQRSIAWFSVLALGGMVILGWVGTLVRSPPARRGIGRAPCARGARFHAAPRDDRAHDRDPGRR